MSDTAVKTLNKPRLSVKAQTAATVAAVVSAVALPQIFHALGAVSGLGTALGEVFLPMHLPIILAGLLAGPYVGAISGFLSPIISFALSGMPSAVMLPFMVIELAFYGLSSGLLRNVKLPSIVKVVISQLTGRLIRAAAILLAVYAFGYEGIGVSVIWKSVAVGLPGLCLQWCLLPLIAFWVDNRKKHEE